MIQNLHTHTTFCDGKNTPEEMVQAAISLGMEANDLKLITSILFLVILVVSTERRKKVKSHA